MGITVTKNVGMKTNGKDLEAFRLSNDVEIPDFHWEQAFQKGSERLIRTWDSKHKR